MSIKLLKRQKLASYGECVCVGGEGVVWFSGIKDRDVQRLFEGYSKDLFG